MTSLRDEAQNPETPAARLHELIHVPGDLGQHDSDVGWCRGHVAANPNVALATLQEPAADTNDCWPGATPRPTRSWMTRACG